MRWSPWSCGGGFHFWVDPRWSYQCSTPPVSVDNDRFIILLSHISQFLPCLVHGGSIWKTISKFKQELIISAFVTCHDDFTYCSSGLLYDFSSKIMPTHSGCLVDLIKPVLKLSSICSIICFDWSKHSIACFVLTCFSQLAEGLLLTPLVGHHDF